ncbi:serine-rich adhesin for platelets-like [Haliotis asinina]|uniref:serine-rich adhesin for platelets-like n=1 Tax=Haliotis asinina TaxID=109174 RepID=UPI003531AC68
MSRLHVRLQIQFPYVKVLILGIVISLLGLGEVVIGVLAFTHKIWGHYLGTGLWCGVVMFVSGICAISASQIRAPLSAKIYFATAIVGVIVSFVMVILSSGGLDYDSNFYHFGTFNPEIQLKKHNSTVMVHGLALGFSIFSFLANIISVIICLKYVIFDKKVKYTTERTSRKAPNSLQRNVLRGGATDARSSTSSRAPLAERSSRRNHSRRGSDHGSRREAEEFLPGGSRSDSSRRSKERRHRSQRGEERRQRGDCGTPRDNARRNERSRNQRNEIPVPVQVERMTIYDGITEADIVHNDRLPTDFDEEELPPYEEAIRDTYVQVSDINNQVLSINAHNDSMRANMGDQVVVCDIDEDKIYQNVNCSDDENEIHQSAPVIEPEVTVHTGSARERDTAHVEGNNINFNTSTVSQGNKSSTQAKYFQEHNQSKDSDETELYVNQSVIPKQNKGNGRPRGERNASNIRTHHKASSFSSSGLCDQVSDNGPQARRCISAGYSSSLPPGIPPPKPPRFYSDLQDILDSSRSDSSLDRSGLRGVTSDKTYVNVDDVNTNSHHNIPTKLVGPKLNMMKDIDSGRNKNSRYKADYIQLQIRQEPEGSSGLGGKEGFTSTASMSKMGGRFEEVLAHSSPRQSPVTRNVKSFSGNFPNEKVRSSEPPKNLGIMSASDMKGKSVPDSNTQNADSTTMQRSSGDPAEGKESPTSPSSVNSVDMPGFSPVRFSSPTSAFKPYKRGDSATSSGVTSPTSDSDLMSSPSKVPEVSATLPHSFSNKAVQRQTSWKDFMLPSPHHKSDQIHSSSTNNDTKKTSAVLSQPPKHSSPTVMSMNTFPRQAQPTLRISPLSIVRSVGSTGTSTALTTAAAREAVTAGAFPSVFSSGKGNLVMPTSSASNPRNMSTSSSSVTSGSSNPNVGRNSGASLNSSVPISSRSSPWSARDASITSSISLFRPSSSYTTADRNNTMPHSFLRPSISAVAPNISKGNSNVHPSERPHSAHGQVGSRANADGHSGEMQRVQHPGSSVAQASTFQRDQGPTRGQGPSRDQGRTPGQRRLDVVPNHGVIQGQALLEQLPPQVQANPQQGPPQQQQQQPQQQQQQQGKPLFSIIL